MKSSGNRSFRSNQSFEVRPLSIYEYPYSPSPIVRVPYSPWECRPRRNFCNHSEPPTYLLVQASQLLWLVKIHDSYKCSLTLTIVFYPNPSPGWSFQERIYLTVSSPYPKVLRRIVRKASYPSWIHHERMLP